MTIRSDGAEVATVVATVVSGRRVRSECNRGVFMLIFTTVGVFRVFRNPAPESLSSEDFFRCQRMEFEVSAVTREDLVRLRSRYGLEWVDIEERVSGEVRFCIQLDLPVLEKLFEELLNETPTRAEWLSTVVSRQGGARGTQYEYLENQLATVLSARTQKSAPRQLPLL